MTSIVTNTSASIALQTLRSVNSSLSETQRQVSSGLRVGKAADNAAYWSVATTMRSDNKAVSAVQDALGLSGAILDTTYEAIASSIDVMSEMKAKLVTAYEDGVDKTKVNEELTQLKGQLTATLAAASFNGQNWLSWNSSVDSADKQIVTSFIRNNDGTVELGTVSYAINTPPPRTDTDVQYFVDNGGSGEYGILSSEAFAVQAGSAKNYVVLKGATAPATATDLAINNSTTSAELDDMLSTLEGMTKQMTKVASDIGSLSRTVDQQNDFASKLSDSIDSGIGRLVDADMEEQSSRLSALQTQQQLAVQSLSIANSAPRNILSLFQG
ncbi:flagellin [Rhizobium sp. AN80A]|uniref:flagellin N-terminal helical domain-containing protein n=1 Tax=Rhizobium sp. AN80A TaxID=3040673 RepID=UPI0024B3A692|nr:flagellin [Rhizobium sp. AN80A]